MNAAQPFLKVSPSAEFYGEQVRTCSNLFGRDPVFAEPLLLNPLILDVLDGVLLPSHPMGPSRPRSVAKVGYNAEGVNAELSRDPVNGPNCHHYRVHFSGSVQVEANGGHQTLHREMDIFRPYIEHEPDQPNWVVAVNYAGSDFTVANGATRIVPGSHRWPRDRAPHPHEEAQAVMPKGSALFWLGRSFHALGTNHTEQKRAGIITVFSANWLAQEENQFISVPPDIAEKLPDQAQQLLGYRGSPTGWAAERDPDYLLRPGTAAYI